MFKNLLRSIGLIFIFNFLSKPFWIIAENYLQYSVGHESFGKYTGFLAWAIIFNPIMDLGLNQYLVKKLAGAPDQYSKLIRPYFFLKILSSIVYLLVLFLLGGCFFGFTYDNLTWITLCGLIMLATNWLMGGRGILQARQKFNWDAFASIADKLLILIAIIFLIIWKHPIFSYGLTTLIITVSVALIIWIIAASTLKKNSTVDSMKINPVSLLKNSFPLGIITILFTLNEHLNKVIIKATLGDESNGIFAAAFRWFGAFSMYLWTVLPVYYARFSFYHESPNDSITEKQKLFDIGLGMVASPVIFICAYLQFYGEILFRIFKNNSGKESSQMVDLLKILLIGLLLNSIFNIFSTYLTSTGKEKYVNYILIIAIFIGAGLNYFLLPIYGITIAAYSLTISFGILSIGYLYFFYKHAEINIPTKLLSKIFVLVLLSYLTIGGFYHLQINWWLSFILGGLLWVIYILVLRIFEFKIRWN